MISLKAKPDINIITKFTIWKSVIIYVELHEIVIIMCVLLIGLILALYYNKNVQIHHTIIK